MMQPAAPPAPSTYPRPRRSGGWNRPIVVAVLVAGFAAAVIFLVMRPWLIFAANTPTGGDMGAHVLVPAYLRDVLLPSGRLVGWSNGWFAGFPILYFYFPLPALAIVGLDLLLPYGVAFKLVTVLGLLAMPGAGYVLARGMGFARPVATVAAAASAGFVFMESYSIYGANIKSTLAGEYSFSWSFAFALIYLGIVLRDTREGRGFTPKAAVAMAAMLLSHVITSLVVGLVSLPLLARARSARRLAGTWMLGFALAAVWALPLLARIGYTSDMNWFPLRGLDEAFPSELWPVMLLGLVGAVWSVVRRYDVDLFLFLTLLPLAAFPFLDGKLWNGRLLPFWFFGVFFFAGLAVGLAALGLVRRLPAGRPALAAVTVLAAASIFLPPLVGMRDASGWARWNYQGYEGKTTWSEYEQLMEVVATLPPGRIMWEANNDMNKYGTPMALMLFPYWTGGAHPSMEGLLFESSLTTPFHFLNAAELSRNPSNPIPGLPYRTFDFDRGLDHMALFDVRYYVSYTEEATAEARARPEFREVAAAPPWTVFELPEADLIDVAEFAPAVYETDFRNTLWQRLSHFLFEDDRDDFFGAAVDWYERTDLLDHWLVEEGPAEWPRVSEGLAGLSDTAPTAADGVVTDVVLEDHRIAFRTSAVGVPHLVKVSYFPTWKASGADGPYRAAPAFMVVVPTAADVELTFEAGLPERGGAVLTLAAVAFLAVWVVRRRRLARLPGPLPARHEAAQPDQPEQRAGDPGDERGSGGA